MPRLDIAVFQGSQCESTQKAELNARPSYFLGIRAPGVGGGRDSWPPASRLGGVAEFALPTFLCPCSTHGDCVG